MSFRNLDINHDFEFGAGRNNYMTGNDEIALNLKTRILSFLGDCFFATNEGIDWFNLLEYNKQEQLELAVQSVIANTPQVVSVNSVNAILGADRKINIQYNIDTVYSENYEDIISPISI